MNEPVEFLKADLILRELSAQSRRHLRNLEILFEVDSTNTRLLTAKPPPPGVADVCTSELQHAGRGRFGRRWIAPFGSGLAISLAWCFDDAAVLPGLSLAVGVAAARALVRAGAAQIALKWPNDIWYRGRKVGGVLVEVRAEAGGAAHVVLGIGLNVHLTTAARLEIESDGAHRIAAVADACATPPSRNRIAGTLLDELLSMLAQFEHTGFPALRNEWTDLDAFNGRCVLLQQGNATTEGIARGADLDGALLLEIDGRLQRFVSGEASVRLLEGEL